MPNFGLLIRYSPRFIKSQYAGKRAAPGSHSSRAQIETRYSADKSDVGVKSSALSDTSEAPSLGNVHILKIFFGIECGRNLKIIYNLQLKVFFKISLHEGCLKSKFQ